MKQDENLGFFDCTMARKNQKAQKFSEPGSRHGLDTVVAAESLFKGTVVNPNRGVHFGGGNYAQNDSTTN